MRSLRIVDPAHHDWSGCQRDPRALEHLLKVPLRDADRPTNLDRGQIAAGDPRPDGLRMDPQALRDITDGQELVVRRDRWVAATGRVVIRVPRHRRNGAPSDRHVLQSPGSRSFTPSPREIQSYAWADACSFRRPRMI